MAALVVLLSFEQLCLSRQADLQGHEALRRDQERRGQRVPVEDESLRQPGRPGPEAEAVSVSSFQS